jgi:hypothetical protein
MVKLIPVHYNPLIFLDRYKPSNGPLGYLLPCSGKRKRWIAKEVFRGLIVSWLKFNDYPSPTQSSCPM